MDKEQPPDRFTKDKLQLVKGRLIFLYNYPRLSTEETVQNFYFFLVTRAAAAPSHAIVRAMVPVGDFQGLGPVIDAEVNVFHCPENREEDLVLVLYQVLPRLN